MSFKLTKIIFSGLICVRVAFAGGDKAAVSPDRVSVFQVPLVCPAATQIGCGSRAKPILLAFEREPPVEAAWLNRAGTLMAIVWRPETKRKARRATFKEVSTHEALDARELAGTERKKALEDFPSEKQWLRGSDVDRLSEEEARIVADRLIRKIRNLVTLTDQQANGLQQQIGGILKRKLTGELPEGSSPRDEVLKALRQELNEKDVILLQDALKDYRPGRDE